ncbi:MAG: DUF429 domain-containing protein [Candidatus Fermentibacteraceae bacterium]
MNPDSLRIAGIDCATRPEKTGSTLGALSPDGILHLKRAMTGTDRNGILDEICSWLEGRNRALVCMDAPLGWPRPMGDSLIGHRSGEGLLEDLRKRLDEEIPLAWSHEVNRVAAIEVYPAGTLVARGWPSSGYKGADKRCRQERQTIVERLAGEVVLGSGVDRILLQQNADALDSAMCSLAGRDFIEQQCYRPENMDLAEKEGWIWVRRL